MKRRYFIKKLVAEEYARIKAMGDEERALHWKKIMTAEYEASKPVYNPATGIQPDEWAEMMNEAEDEKLGFMKNLHKKDKQFKNEKFHNLPDDAGTLIMASEEVKFGVYDVLFQHWLWDGIEGESLIFIASDVAHLSDEELLKEVEDSALNTVKSGVTIKRNTHGFTFVNLNFETSE